MAILTAIQVPFFSDGGLTAKWVLTRGRHTFEAALIHTNRYSIDIDIMYSYNFIYTWKYLKPDLTLDYGPLLAGWWFGPLLIFTSTGNSHPN